MKKFTALLIALALIAGTVGCPAEPGPDPDPPVRYQLTIASTEGGSVTTPGEGVFTFGEGTVISLVAVPANGYRFVGWSGDIEAIADVNRASISFALDRDRSITANFVAQHVLLVASTSGGTVTAPGEGTFTYDAGMVVDLVVEPEAGYKFVTWTGAVDTIANVHAASTNITVNGDYSVTAEFVMAHIYFDKIGPGPWGVYTVGEGVEIAVTEEGLEVSMASDSADDPDWQPPSFAGFGGSEYALKGDFDVRMGYELTTWPQRSGVRVGLIVGILHVPDRIVSVERVGIGPDEFFTQSGGIYVVNFDGQVQGITVTDDLSGTLRMRREGRTLSCYYLTLAGWQKLHEAEWVTGDVTITVAAWSHGYCFGGEEVGVLIKAIEIAEGLS